MKIIRKTDEKTISYCNYGCTSLDRVPDLPAKKADVNSYFGMYENCTSLTEAPEIAATELAFESCGAMFGGCETAGVEGRRLT